jgi:hypothetical protein
MARFGLVGHDKAPTSAFRLLSAHIEASGHACRSHLLDAGTASAPNEGLAELVATCDSLLIGMSTPAKNAAAEISAAETCIAARKPFGFYADTHGAWTRPHFEHLRSRTEFLLVVNSDEADRARTLFPRARINVTGNPLWGAFFEPADRNASRKIVGALESEHIVLAPGTKNPMHNTIVWSAVVQAASRLENHAVVLAKHFGDNTPDDVYRWYVHFGSKLNTRVVLTSHPPDDLVPGADRVVNGTSVRVHAIARRIPVIDYYEPLSQEWLDDDTGSRFSYFRDSGAVLGVYGSHWVELLQALRRLRSNPNLLVASQIGAVEKVQTTDVLDRMLSALIARS